MDTFENNDIPQVNEHTEIPAESVQETPVQTEKEPEVYAPTGENSTYRNAGVGRKESPFANSPYVMNHHNSGNQPAYQTYQYYQNRQNVVQTSEGYGYQRPQPQQPVQPEFPPKQEKTRKKNSKTVFKTILSAVLILALVLGSCVVTASVVNSRWEEENQKMQESFNQQIGAMQQQIQSIEESSNSPAASGNSVSGSPVATGESLSPSQVYAKNVDAVVMIAGYVGTRNSYTAVSTGSGFFISADGYVLTNCHVIEGANSVSVTTRNGKRYDAAIVGYDATNDVALLKVDAGKFPYVTIGSSADLIVGDQVAAIGNPLGELTSTMTVGYVSGKERNVTTDGTTINMIQTDAAINSGNSGGPLFDMKGEVVGITTAKYSGKSSSGASIEGIGFAIPIDDVMKVVADLKEFGYVKSAYMGIMVRDLNAEMAEIYGLPVGAYVDSVEAGGPAAKAGMQAKDIITGLGDFTIRNMSDLTRALRTFEPGDTTTVYIYRAGAQLQLRITLMERPREADTTTPPEPESGMPNEGSYEDWYDYFFPFG
jgi:serine protease Do